MRPAPAGTTPVGSGAPTSAKYTATSSTARPASVLSASRSTPGVRLVDASGGKKPSFGTTAIEATPDEEDELARYAFSESRVKTGGEGTGPFKGNMEWAVAEHEPILHVTRFALESTTKKRF